MNEHLFDQAEANINKGYDRKRAIEGEVVKVFLETGQTVRWRGRRWRVIEEEQNGFVKLIGLDSVNREQVATPLIALEEGALAPDVVPLPILDVEKFRPSPLARPPSGFPHNHGWGPRTIKGD